MQGKIKILDGTENYLNYCLLIAYAGIIIMATVGLNDIKDNLFLFVLFTSIFVTMGNIWSFKEIHKKENLLNREVK